MSKSYKIAVLPGDGIGTEIIPQGIKALEAAGNRLGISFEFEEALVGGASLDVHGVPLTDETLKMCTESDGVFLGAVGGPKWDVNPDPAMRPERGALFPIRKALGTYANLRPIVVFNALTSASSLKTERVEGGLDILIVRELTGGIYFGQPKERRTINGEQVAIDTCPYSESEITRVAHIAFSQAKRRRGKVTSVDKSNAMESSKLWREVVGRVGEEYPDIELSHMLADNCAMQLLRDPKQFDIILTDNLFGDILSDEASMLAGSLGMLPSAAIGGTGAGLYEPIHGSAPDIVGQDISNPIATILTAAMLMRYACNSPEGAALIRNSVEKVLEAGYRTTDIAISGDKVVGCSEMGDLVRDAIFQS